jgi:hypothetical protein
MQHVLYHECSKVRQGYAQGAPGHRCFRTRNAQCPELGYKVGFGYFPVSEGTCKLGACVLQERADGLPVCKDPDLGVAQEDGLQELARRQWWSIRPPPRFAHLSSFRANSQQWC